MSALLKRLAITASDANDEPGFYPPLPPGNCLRVLSNDIDARGRKRKYRLVARSIDDEQPYTSLSYRWGNSNTRCRITVNGRSFTVMRTVRDFLNLYMDKQQRGQIFIDSICINQHDLDERASQVRLMGKIYANAAKVIIWLDHGVSDDDLQDPEVKLFGDSLRVQHIFSKVYWTRAWVIQEILLAKKIELFFNYSTIFEDTLQAMVKSCDMSKINVGSQASIFSRRIHQYEPEPLDRLIGTYGYTTASDDRDKIYALLGLASDVDDTSIRVDYSKGYSPYAVFCDVVAYCNPDFDRLLPFSRDLARWLRPSGYPHTTKYSMEHRRARGYMVSVVEDTGRVLRREDLKQFCQSLAPRDSDHDNMRQRIWANPHDKSHMVGPIHVSDPAPSEATLFQEALFSFHLTSLRAESHIVGIPEHESSGTVATATEEIPSSQAIFPVEESELGDSTRVYNCKNLDAAKFNMTAMSGNTIKPGDVICKFRDMPYGLAVRKSDGVYYGVGKVCLCDKYSDLRGDWRTIPVKNAAQDSPGKGLTSMIFQINVLALSDFVRD